MLYEPKPSHSLLPISSTQKVNSTHQNILARLHEDQSREAKAGETPPVAVNKDVLLLMDLGTFPADYAVFVLYQI